MSSSRFMILAIAVGLCSCKELYNDYQPEAGEKYLVVEGMITDEPGPYYVTISKAVAYSNDLDLYNYKPEMETSATVKIISDKGVEIVLDEMVNAPGTYSTKKEELTGEIGHSYWLYIETEKGEIYESLPSVLMDKPEIPYVYATNAEKSYLDESIPGSSTIVTKKGMQLACDVVNNSSSKYVKINTRIITQNTYFLDSFYYNTRNAIIPGMSVFVTEGVDTIFCLNLRAADPAPNIVGMGNTVANSILREVPLGFVVVYDPVTEKDTNITMNFWDTLYIADRKFYYDSLVVIKNKLDRNNIFIADINAYCINDAVYEYYRNVNNQVTARNKIFDPIPTQLTGNIVCKSDPGKNIYGVFTVASVARIQFYIRYRGEYTDPGVVKLDEYITYDQGYCLTDPPAFWKAWY